MNLSGYENSCFNVFDDKSIDTLELLRYRNLLSKYHVYVICMTPRSGSSFLADLLWKTESAGHPGEFFNHKLLSASLKGLASKGLEVRTLLQYMHWLIRSRSSKNKVLGVKASYFQFKPMMALGLEETLLGHPTYICLSRRNIVRQSVSMFLASKTKFFHSVQKQQQNAGNDQPEYDNEALKEWVRHIHVQEQGWSNYFSAENKQFLKVEYDSLTADPVSTMTQIFNHLGIDTEGVDLGQRSEHSKIGNTLNNEFFDRFVKQRGNLDFLSELGLGPDRIEGR